jgi:hypothetical protein
MPTARSPFLPTIPMPSVDQRIDRAVDSACAELPPAQKNWGPSDWASLAHVMMRCGASQEGLTQARIYAGTVQTIIGGILYLMPDAYGTEFWRRTARRLISEALPNATKDRQLVAVLNQMRSQLATNPRHVDLLPSFDSVTPRKLVPAGATQITSHYEDSVKITDIWFLLPLGLTDTQSRTLTHLRALGWYACPPENPSAPHDVIVIEPTPQRPADQYFDASLRNEWDITALLYAEGSDASRVEYRVSKVEMGPLCSPRHSGEHKTSSKTPR